VRQRQGMKRFILTSIDPVTHIAFAYAPPSGASGHAAKLHEAITENFPDLARSKALTDNVLNARTFSSDRQSHPVTAICS